MEWCQERLALQFRKIPGPGELLSDKTGNLINLYSTGFPRPLENLEYPGIFISNLNIPKNI
jgi:hypothetical protein